MEIICPREITDGIDGDDPFVDFAWSRPDFRCASHEFLIGLLSTAAAPEDDEDWEDWWHEPPSPEDLNGKFESVREAFYLDGPGPCFLQDYGRFDGEKSKVKGVASLLIDSPGDQTLKHNTDLFVKRGNAEVMSRASAAMALFILNAYSPSGGAGHLTSMRGGGPLTTLVLYAQQNKDGTLWGRLWPNVENSEQIHQRDAREDKRYDLKTIFPWLAPTRRTSKGLPSREETTSVHVHPLQVYWGMPRRIRLEFTDANGKSCDVTGEKDTKMVSEYKTINYGTNYTEGFCHPLTPRRKKDPDGFLHMLAKPAGVSYRNWVGLVISGRDGTVAPAVAVSNAIENRMRKEYGLRASFSAYGFAMNKMKPLAWIESEMPLVDSIVGVGETKEAAEDQIRLVIKAAEKIARKVVLSVKSALFARPSEVSITSMNVEEQFYRDTEQSFYDSISKEGIETDDARLQARVKWLLTARTVAMRLFDDNVPSEGLEDRDMLRYVKYRLYLGLLLSGRSKEGLKLYQDDLKIPVPKTRKKAKVK